MYIIYSRAHRRSVLVSHTAPSSFVTNSSVSASSVAKKVHWTLETLDKSPQHAAPTTINDNPRQNAPEHEECSGANSLRAHFNVQ